jgi:DUF4097 and DUF4098 domain-containing protein YvlB
MRRSALAVPFLAALFPTALFLTGCDENWNIGTSDRYREDFHFSETLAAGGRLQVDNFNGSVEISGWDKDTVDISGTKYANTESRLHDIRIEVTSSAGMVSIRTVRPSDRWGNAGARYVIHVPRKVELDTIASSNGSIHVDFIEGRARLRTSNGSVRAGTIHGPLDVQTSNGTIEVSDITGDTVLHSTNGAIRADILKGSLDAHTSNGSMNVRLEQPDSKPVRLDSSNGHIDLTMNAIREVRAETSNSSITVHLPMSAGAQVRARTSNSSVTTDFDVSVHGSLTKHHLEGAIGGGGPLLDLSTSNGAIRILRL